MLRKFLVAQEGKRMVVIGSSFIGMELVVAVAKRGLASIDVIGMEEYPFQSVLGKEVGHGLQKVATLIPRLLSSISTFFMIVSRVSRRQVSPGDTGREDHTIGE
jgi:hypothetical protein